MKQSISALMDGELFEDEAENLLGEMKDDPAVRKNWSVYHLIGDALRQPDHIHRDISAKVRERLQAEPVVLVSRGRATKHKIRTWAISAAASVAAVGTVVWMSLQISPEGMPKMAMQQQSANSANLQSRTNPNDYLVAHQEFSPSTEMDGTSYIRTVSYGVDDVPAKP